MTNVQLWLVLWSIFMSTGVVAFTIACAADKIIRHINALPPPPSRERASADGGEGTS